MKKISANEMPEGCRDVELAMKMICLANNVLKQGGKQNGNTIDLA